MTRHDPRSTVRAVVRVEQAREEFDRVVVEEPLEIRVGDEPIAVTMRTPGEDEDLAIGFLVTEGVLSSPDEVRGVHRPEPNVVEVEVAPGVDARSAKRAMYSASSCGLCGKGTISAISIRVPRIDDETTFDLDTLLSFSEQLRAGQPTFDRTGGLHAVALFDRDGALKVLREDVGRHNATDKVIGSHFRRGGSFAGSALLVSGRAGFEIVQKAAVARIPLVAAISAPSSLAIDLADRVGITLAAFVRPPRAGLYAHPERVRV